MANSIKKNIIHLQDCIEGLKNLPDESVDILLYDPPYNIGKDFGNDSDKQELTEYVKWCKEWLTEGERVLKKSGTMFIYGFSEILAHISVQVTIKHRWLIWHYTNKTVPSLRFWQRSHESIIIAWKDEKQRIFNLDDVREPYTETYLKNAAGKVRKATQGRFSKGEKETVYTAHENGAFPRDVLKYSALAGGAGAKERFFYCQECQESFFNSDKDDHKNHTTFNHPTQKPYQLTEKLLQSAMNKEGKTLLVVPFCGSGSELIVAQDLGIDYIAFEINKEYLKMAKSILTKASKNKKTKE